jgi:hypothetical protein
VHCVQRRRTNAKHSDFRPKALWTHGAPPKMNFL